MKEYTETIVWLVIFILIASLAYWQLKSKESDYIKERSVYESRLEMFKIEVEHLQNESKKTELYTDSLKVLNNLLRDENMRLRELIEKNKINANNEKDRIFKLNAPASIEFFSEQTN